MRKYVIGALFGFLLASVVPAYGAVSSLVGKKITKEYKVTVDGVELSKKSIAVDGTSYVPARSFAEAFGYDISLQNNTVVFESVDPEPTETPPPTETGGSVNIPSETGISIKGLESKIESAKIILDTLNGSLKFATTDEVKSQIETQITDVEQQIKDLEAQLAALEAQ